MFINVPDIQQLCVMCVPVWHVLSLHIEETAFRQGHRYGGIRDLNPPPDINNKSLIKIKFLSILVDV